MSLVDDHTDHTEHNELKKVDSAIGGLSISDKAEKADKKAHRRTSSQAEGVYNIKELGKSTQCYRESYDDSDTRLLCRRETH
jgi:hypothetical protein